MAIRGPKPKPTVLRFPDRIAGKPVGNPAEPRPKGRPTPPQPLTGRHLALWRRQVSPAFWLSAADGYTAFMWVHLAAEFEADPAAMNAARISQLRALSSSLGFDPSSRTRLGGDRSAPTNASGYFTDRVP